MDIKIRLEDDKVLGISTETKKFLNSKGIYTIEDFLNVEESNLPITRSNYYLAMQHIFKHAYLNQEFIYDVLLEKEYELNKKGIEEFAKDYIKLGLVDKSCSVKNIVRDMEEWIKNNCEYINSDKISMKVMIEELIEENKIGDELYKLRKDSRKEISHDEYEIKTYELKKKMLKHPNISIKHLNILKYYKDYINVKKDEKVEDENDTYTLMYLKNQIKQLNGQRNNLDKQIEVLQNRVDEILEERKTNGKQFKY